MGWLKGKVCTVYVPSDTTNELLHLHSAVIPATEVYSSLGTQAQ